MTSIRDRAVAYATSLRDLGGSQCDDGANDFRRKAHTRLRSQHRHPWFVRSDRDGILRCVECGFEPFGQ